LLWHLCGAVIVFVGAIKWSAGSCSACGGHHCAKQQPGKKSCAPSAAGASKFANQARRREEC
jgi:hypothetical protein